MNADALLELVALLDPVALNRAKRLHFALQLLRTGTNATEAQKIVRVRCEVSRSEAWKAVDMARDMVMETQR